MTNYFPFQYSFVKKKKRIRATTMSSFLNSKEEYLYYSWFFLFCSREVIPIRITERFISFNCFGCWVYRNFFNASRFGEIKLLFAMFMSWVLCLFVDGYSRTVKRSIFTIHGSFYFVRERLYPLESPKDLFLLIALAVGFTEISLTQVDLEK